MRYSPNFADNPIISAEFLRISEVLTEISELQFPTTYKAPDKPRDGMARYADGTEWNPGSGEGLYYYSDGSWISLAGGITEGSDNLDITEFDDTDATYYFYGGVDTVGDWKINRYLKTTLAKTSADEVSDPAYTTLGDAWTNRLTLSYS